MGDLVKRAFTEAPVEALVQHGQVVEVGVGVLLRADDLPLEVHILTRALAAARSTGPIGKAGILAYCRAWPNYYMGHLTDAIADAEEALRAAELGWEAFFPAAVHGRRPRPYRARRTGCGRGRHRHRPGAMGESN